MPMRHDFSQAVLHNISGGNLVWNGNQERGILSFLRMKIHKIFQQLSLRTV